MARLPERVHVSGNLKFEVKPPARPAIVETFHAALEREEIGPLIVAGSTLEGEEAMLLEMFRLVASRYPGALLVLAPRHPERFPVVASLLAASGLRWQRRSEWDGARAIAGGVFLLDTIGELASLYEFADIAFVGGSLVPRGGHNVLEAAQFGTAILVGPHTENFRDIVEAFRKADALRVVTMQSLTPTVLQLAGESRRARAALGQRAAEVVRSQQGATQQDGGRAAWFASRFPRIRFRRRCVEDESALCSSTVPSPAHATSFYDRGVLSARRLHGPVVSIGNIAAGGSGKTPFRHGPGRSAQAPRRQLRRALARLRPQDEGRGAGRSRMARPRDFGDEPLLIARKLEVSVVVGEDRYAAGRFAEENFGPRLHLLDDGFQHRGLARDFDIVLVNASDAEVRCFRVADCASRCRRWRAPTPLF